MDITLKRKQQLVVGTRLPRLLTAAHIKRHNNESIFIHLLLAITLLFTLMVTAVNAENVNDKNNDKTRTNKKLSSVKKAIEQQKNAIVHYQQSRKNIEKTLKADDLAISKVAKAINNTQQQLSTTQQQIAELAQQKTTLTIKKQRQEKLLAQQLRTAYTTGHHNYLKLLLNQEKTAKMQRTLTYYQYLNVARVNAIEKFQLTLSDLLQITAEHQTQIKQLTQLQSEQKQQRIQLKENKTKRAKTLVSLKKTLLNSEQQLKNLEAEEKNLISALKKLERLIKKQVHLNGLAQLKHKLTWPIKGKIKHRFGQQKQGYLKWKGVFISANVGKQIQTIHNGTILFADWLKGYGLVTVIDHGNGYMSLYAHNQTLLKNVGDQVEQGEPIALVGQSGGQSRAGVYFEIRHRGKAVNPKLWCQ